MTFPQADGTPGAAAWVLQNQLRGDWRREDAVAANTQFDAVHRLIGRPGIVLVGEGSPQRVRGLIAQEKRRIARVAGETPIYDIVVGNGEGEVPLAKLNLRAQPAAAQPVQGRRQRARQAAAGPRWPAPAAAAGADAGRRQDAQRPACRPPPHLTRRAGRTAEPAGSALGLPPTGPGSIAPTGRRLGALIVDCLAVGSGRRPVHRLARRPQRCECVARQLEPDPVRPGLRGRAAAGRPHAGHESVRDPGRAGRSADPDHGARRGRADDPAGAARPGPDLGQGRARACTTGWPGPRSCWPDPGPGMRPVMGPPAP